LGKADQTGVARTDLERRQSMGKDSTKPKKKAKKTKKHGGAGALPVTIDVVLISDGPTPDFVLRSEQIDITVLSINGKNYQVLNFSNTSGGTYHPGFVITFNLIDSTNKGYVFWTNPVKPDPNDAIWVQKIDGDIYCPTAPSQWGVFKPTGVTETTLTVSNPNGKLQYFGFTLLLSLPGAAKASLSLDPVGNNQNGSSARW
jgi:hypothetical protein